MLINVFHVESKEQITKTNVQNVNKDISQIQLELNVVEWIIAMTVWVLEILIKELVRIVQLVLIKILIQVNAVPNNFVLIVKVIVAQPI